MVYSACYDCGGVGLTFNLKAIIYMEYVEIYRLHVDERYQSIFLSTLRDVFIKVYMWFVSS